MEALRTSDVAKMLGLKSAMLRRHAQSYENVFGDLKTDNNGRRYDQEFIERLQTALNAYHDGSAPSVQDALEAIRDNSALIFKPEPTKEDIILELLKRQNETIQALEEKLSAFGRQLQQDNGSRVKELEDTVSSLKLELERKSKPWWRVW